MSTKKQKKALITGISGQDGSYLAEILLKKDYKVYGLIRRTSDTKAENIVHIQDSLNLIYGDLMDPTSLVELFRKTGKVDEVYNLASQSLPGLSFKLPIYTAEVTGLGAHRVFEAVRRYSPEAKVYQASSSELYGWVKEQPQNEDTPFNPANPYAASKQYAHSIAQIYKKAYGMFITCGILFNHESPRRGLGFVTQKVAYAAACAKLGIETSQHLNEEGEPIVQDGKVALGNMDASRDWGFSKDYVWAMWKMLQLSKPEDFVVATGKLHTIKDLCKAAFGHVDLNYKDFVYVDQRFVRPTETGPLVGDASKAKKELGFNPTVTFEELIGLMVDMHIAKLT